MTGSLTSLQLYQYRERGFIKPIRVFSIKRAHDICLEIERLERHSRTGTHPADIQQYFRVNGQVVIKLLADLGHEPAILNAVESIIGPDIMLWSCELFIKEPRSRSIVTWHQDLTYWGMGGTDLQASAWVALSNATAENGAMRFIPGSHKLDLVPHNDSFSADNLLSRGQEVAVEVNENKAVPDDLQAGEMSIHHGKIFHASGPNLTDERRIGMVLRYISPKLMRVLPGKDYAMLVRGADRIGNWINVARPSSDFGENEMRLYNEMLTFQASTLADGADQKVNMYEVS